MFRNCSDFDSLTFAVPGPIKAQLNLHLYIILKFHHMCQLTSHSHSSAVLARREGAATPPGPGRDTAAG